MENIFELIYSDNILELEKILSNDPKLVKQRSIIRDKEFTPIMAAASEGKLEICKLIMRFDHRPFMFISNYSALILACCYGHLEIVKYFVHKINFRSPKERKNYFENSMETTVVNGWCDILEFLCDYNKFPEYIISSFNYSIINDKLDCLYILIRKFPNLVENSLFQAADTSDNYFNIIFPYCSFGGICKCFYTSIKLRNYTVFEKILFYIDKLEYFRPHFWSDFLLSALHNENSMGYMSTRLIETIKRVSDIYFVCNYVYPSGDNIMLKLYLDKKYGACNCIERYTDLDYKNSNEKNYDISIRRYVYFSV